MYGRCVKLGGDSSYVSGDRFEDKKVSETEINNGYIKIIKIASDYWLVQRASTSARTDISSYFSLRTNFENQFEEDFDNLRVSVSFKIFWNTNKLIQQMC